MKPLQTSKRLRTFQNFVNTTASVLTFARHPRLTEFAFTAIIQDMWLACERENEECALYPRDMFVHKVIMELKETFKGERVYSEKFSISDLYTENAI